MKRGLQLLVVAACALGGASLALAYQPNTIVWPEDRQPIEVGLHEHTVNELSIEDLEAVVMASFEEWNRVPCSSIVLEYTGLTQERVQPNDTQVLEWIDDPALWGGLGSMTAGATMIDSFRDLDTGELAYLHVDIAFNAVNFTWQVGGAANPANTGVIDPESVLTHEVGHLMGLGHTSDDASATMAAAYSPDLNQRSLGLDDKQGICDLYWAGEDECQGDADCREGELCVTWTSQVHGQEVKSCAEQRGDYGDDCNIRDLRCDPCNLNGQDRGCASLCLFTNGDRSEGYCTTRCEDDSDCPSCWECNNLQSVQVPFYTCQPVEGPCEEPGEDMGSPDMGTDMGTDMGDQGDMGVPDTNQDANLGNVDVDQGGQEGGSGGGDGCGCAQVGGQARPTGAWLWALGLLGLGWAGRRRSRRRSATPSALGKVAAVMLAVAALSLGAGAAQAQGQDEFTFDAQEISLRTYVVLLEAERGVSKRDQRAVLADAQEAVNVDAGHEIIKEREAQRSLGRREARAFSRCKDRSCLLQYSPSAQLDRLLVMRITKAEGVYVVDLELIDGISGKSLGFDAVPAEDLRQPGLLLGAIERLLNPPPPVIEEPVVQQPIIEEPILEEPKEEPSGEWMTPALANYTLYGGVGLLAVGGVLALMADNTQAEIQAQPHDAAKVMELIDSGETLQLSANVFLGLGVAALGTGAVFYFLTREEGQGSGETLLGQEAPRLRLDLAPNAVQLRLDY